MYYCSKYSGYISTEKAFANCIKRGCPHLERDSQSKRKKKRWAQDAKGRSKAGWRG